MKKDLKKKSCERYKNLSEEEKSGKMVMNETRISLKMGNKG